MSQEHALLLMRWPVRSSKDQRLVILRSQRLGIDGNRLNQRKGHGDKIWNLGGDLLVFWEEK